MMQNSNLDGKQARYHPKGHTSKDVTLKQTHVHGFYDVIDSNGWVIDKIEANKALNNNDITIYNAVEKAVAIPLHDVANLHLNTDRVLWIVDNKQHPYAKDGCEMINAPIFQPDTFGAWLSSSIAIVKQVQNNNNNNNICDTATILKPSDVRTYINESNGITQTVLIESISRTSQTAPQYQICFKPLWSLKDVLQMFKKELEVPSRTSPTEVLRLAHLSGKFHDPSHILHRLSKDDNLIENIDSMFVLSCKFIKELSFTDVRDCFTVTKLVRYLKKTNLTLYIFFTLSFMCVLFVFCFVMQ